LRLGLDLLGDEAPGPLLGEEAPFPSDDDVDALLGLVGVRFFTGLPRAGEERKPMGGEGVSVLGEWEIYMQLLAGISIIY
jgi:hypothetical protein